MSQKKSKTMHTHFFSEGGEGGGGGEGKRSIKGFVPVEN